MPNLFIQILVLVLVLVFALYFLVIKNSKRTSETKTIKPHKFVLCSQPSIDYAVSLIQTFARQQGFHSYDIYDNPDDLIRSFHFLRDCYYFCDNTPYYKNDEWETNVVKIYLVSYMAINVPSSEIPKDILENSKFGNQWRKLNPINELKEFDLIYWRSKMQWLYWANLYNDDKEMHSKFIEMANATLDK